MAAAPDLEKVLAVDTSPLPNGISSGSEKDDSGFPTKHDFVPLDGGIVAWSQVLAGNLVNWMAWGLPATFGVYQLYYRDTLHLPQSQISWIGSTQVFLAFLMCALSGRLADAGYARQTIAAGSFLTIFGTFMTSLATKYWQILLAQGICTGLGLGIMFMPPLAVINSYFKKKRSLALAISATGTGLGSVVFPATVQYLIPRIGFPWAVRCSAFVALFISTISILLIKPRLAPRRSGSLVEWGAFKEAPYVLYTMGAFLFFWALYFGFFYINTYARNIVGFDTVTSVRLLLITNGMSVPSRPLAGYLADRHLGPINTFTIATFLLSGMLFAWAGVQTRTAMYVFSAFFGLSNGAAQGVFVGSLASLTEDPRKMGTRFGMVCTIAAFATLAGPPTAGAIIDRDGGRYLWAQIWAGLTIALGAFMLTVARWKKTGWRLWVKI